MTAHPGRGRRPSDLGDGVDDTVRVRGAEQTTSTVSGPMAAATSAAAGRSVRADTGTGSTATRR